MTQFPGWPQVGIEFSVSDHVARSEFFLLSASTVEDVRVFNWLLMSAVYSARAPIEIASNEIETVLVNKDKSAFLADAERDIRRFKLIASIRAHDFHRQAIHLERNKTVMYGPVNLRTSKQPSSSVGVSLDPVTGTLAETKIRNASVSYNRPIQLHGFEVFDFERNEYVLLFRAVQEYLTDLKPFFQLHFPRVKWADTGIP